MSVELVGLKEMEKILDQIAPKYASNLARATIHGVAGEIAKEAKKNVPVDTGNLKKSLKTKRRRGKPGKPVSDVIATQGKDAKNDGYYWYMVENGTTNMPERPFIRPAVDTINAKLPEIFSEQFTKKLAQAVKRAQKKAQLA